MALAAVAINLVVDVVLIPRIGIVAGAIGTDLALAVYVPAHLWICARAIGPRPAAARPGARALARRGGGDGGRAARRSGTLHLSVLDWVLGGAARSSSISPCCSCCAS